ncbi:CobW family GTP-binding protein [Halopseudomonas salina]|uniref:Cobalamin biosynthesis protein CobW n=1 Tax=Halopseudomonas salina TaxID=1323744 RepID=A0ABQ1PCC9_9GAMM|nr:CobW family GTP-binding protein [Halopseudomonas salina]GGC94471.1 cobalamin biosynthesis protein CobW [Halopseudomonas salina]
MTISSKIEHVATHLIAGPLGAGKTSLIRSLLAQRPAHERWAVLINEFGQIGIDAALLHTDAAGVQLAEIPGGCLCCVNGVPFQVGLNRLLRRARPHRLFIEASGLGHPQALMRQLAADPWQSVLALQPLIMVIDAPRLLADGKLSEPQQLALESAGLAVLNKTEELTSEQCTALILKVRPVPTVCAVQGVLDLSQLPVSVTFTGHGFSPQLPDATLPPGKLWRNVDDWHCHRHQQTDQHSIGWVIHPHQIFHLDEVRSWLDRFSCHRAKGVLHTTDGWMSFNAVAGDKPVWHPSAWRRDNRLELISSSPFDGHELESALRATVATPSTHSQRELP